MGESPTVRLIGEAVFPEPDPVPPEAAAGTAFDDDGETAAAWSGPPPPEPEEIELASGERLSRALSVPRPESRDVLSIDSAPPRSSGSESESNAFESCDDGHCTINTLIILRTTFNETDAHATQKQNEQLD